MYIFSDERMACLVYVLNIPDFAKQRLKAACKSQTSKHREQFPNRSTTEVKIEVTLWLTVCLGVEHFCGTYSQILLPVSILLSEICGPVSVGRPLWKEEGSAICSAITHGLSPTELITILYCHIWDSPNLEGQVPVFISPRNRVAQLYPRALGSFLRRLLRLARLGWRYSNPPRTWRARSPYIYPSGTGWSSPKSKSRYVRWPVN
jgi:hypothetical protein